MNCDKCGIEVNNLFVDSFDWRSPFAFKRKVTDKSYCMGCFEEVVCGENKRILDEEGGVMPNSN